MHNTKLLVCDLDNTLYDWVGYFVPSFYAMVDEAVNITQCNREELLDDLRSVHQKYNDSEQPFALLETETIRRHYKSDSSETILHELDPAFHAFNSARRRYLKLHSNVIETLDVLSANGVRLVAHTESKLFGVVDRLRRLGLVQYFSHIYCRERAVSIRPRADVDQWLENFPMNRVIELSQHQAKPNPAVLAEICADEGFAPADTAYVGDSIARDILMAKKAGVFAIWAAYGAEHSPVEYRALVRISHWTPEEVEREGRLKEEAKSIRPDYVAQRSFAEVPAALGIGAERTRR